jgi:hypothetical protein
MKPSLLTAIEPKPKTVAEFFRGHPERWTKRSMYRGRQGNSCSLDTAVCACLGGAVNFVYGNDCHAIVDKLSGLAIDRTMKSDYPTSNFAAYNDWPATSFEDILSLAEAANV